MIQKHFLASICPILSKYLAHEEKFHFTKTVGGI